MHEAYGYVRRRPVALHMPGQCARHAQYLSSPKAVYRRRLRWRRASSSDPPSASTRNGSRPWIPKRLRRRPPTASSRSPRAIYGGMLFPDPGPFPVRIGPRVSGRAWTSRPGGAGLPLIFHPSPSFELPIFLEMPFLVGSLAAFDRLARDAADRRPHLLSGRPPLLFRTRCRSTTINVHPG